jgi:hypothetical protein
MANDTKKAALYRVYVKEHGKADKTLQIVTSDIEKYLESYKRTRNIQSCKIIGEEVIASKNMLLG